MNLAKLQQLLSYDQPSNIQSVDCYLLNIPSTLRYPTPSDSDVESIIDTIQRDTFIAIDQIAWQHIRLLLLEPHWLQTPAKRTQIQSIASAIFTHPNFVQRILAHYKFVSIYKQTPFHQECLLLTASALQQLISNMGSDIDDSIFNWSKSIIDCVVQSPNEWSLLINGADWLIDELQLEVGFLFDFLHDLTLAKTTTPQSALESTISKWTQQQQTKDIQAIHNSLSQNEQRIRALFHSIERTHNKPKPPDPTR